MIMTNVNESNVEFLGCVASLQVAPYIDVIVADNASDQVRCGDTLCPLSGHKHAWNVNIKDSSEEQQFHYDGFLWDQ